MPGGEAPLACFLTGGDSLGLLFPDLGPHSRGSGIEMMRPDSCVHLTGLPCTLPGVPSSGALVQILIFKRPLPPEPSIRRKTVSPSQMKAHHSGTCRQKMRPLESCAHTASHVSGDASNHCPLYFPVTPCSSYCTAHLPLTLDPAVETHSSRKRIC